MGLKAAALLLLAGCAPATQSDGLNREVVSGTVTLDGKPLDSGSIQFLPADPNSPGGASGKIQNGTYRIERDRGPTAGSYKVAISSATSTEVPEDAAPGEAPKMKPDPIPAKYNTATTLTTDIKSGASNTADFALETKK